VGVGEDICGGLPCTNSGGELGILYTSFVGVECGDRRGVGA